MVLFRVLLTWYKLGWGIKQTSHHQLLALAIKLIPLVGKNIHTTYYFSNNIDKNIQGGI